MTQDKIALAAIFVLLVIVFLPHWLDPVIRWRDRLEGYEPEPLSSRSQAEIVVAILIAVASAAIGAAVAALVIGGY